MDDFIITGSIVLSAASVLVSTYVLGWNNGSIYEINRRRERERRRRDGIASTPTSFFPHDPIRSKTTRG